MEKENIVRIDDLEKTTIVIVAPGISKEDVKIKADDEENKLSIIAKSSIEMPEGLEESFDFDIKETITVGKCREASAASVKVGEGLILIEVPSAKHIKSVDVN